MNFKKSLQKIKPRNKPIDSVTNQGTRIMN